MSHKHSKKMVVSCCTSLSLTEMVFLTGKNHFKDLQHVLYQPSKFLLEQICLTLLPKGANITYAHAKKHTHTQQQLFGQLTITTLKLRNWVLPDFW